MGEQVAAGLKKKINFFKRFYQSDMYLENCIQTQLLKLIDI